MRKKFNKLQKLFQENMTGRLLILIYLAFISLGLPDSLLGVAWPVMRTDFNLPLSAAGWVSMIIAGGTIISSINSGRLIHRFGTGKLTLLSCLLTSGALFGISRTPTYTGLILMAIPLGLGAGAVDSALNHFVAEHYKVHHMNWLHAFWGIGATIGPLIMLNFLANNPQWRTGYLSVSGIQFIIVLFLFFSLGLWQKVAASHKVSSPDGTASHSKNTLKSMAVILRIPGVKSSLLSFFLYCSVEVMVSLWGASYLVEIKGILPDMAASWISIYYAGITIGRILNGFFSLKFKNRYLILFGQLLSLFGILCLIFPLPVISCKIGLLFIGLGLAPIFPGLLHETPGRFGKQYSAPLIGYQMASAYVGITFVPPLFGLFASLVGIKIFPLVSLLFLVGLIVFSEWTVLILARHKSHSKP